ncbi:VTT domain-containing protein [Streptomyces sp. NPDC088124]|uniref:DedA family protein n=1 Tax=Streptomyces sp. NPDC088124 TaxID=3154654 RepID=UPI003417C1F2
MIAFAESVVGIGFFVPGGAALLFASATVDSVPEFLLLWAVVTGGALVGNVGSFALGRRLGPSLREAKPVRKRGAEGWDRASGLIRKHGRWAVFVGRLIPFGLVQSVVPSVAGAAGMSYRTFLPPIAGGAACSMALPLLVGVGVAAGVQSAGDVGVLVAAGLLLVLVPVLLVRRRRRGR